MMSSSRFEFDRNRGARMRQKADEYAVSPEAVALVPKETQRAMYRYMLLTREIEDRIERKLYRQGKVLGGVYVGRGQEAISIGASIQMRREDVLCPSHRDMGAVLVRGMTPARIFAQYMGRRDGYTRGKDGNMHMGDLGLNIVSFISMLADQVPVAAGVGLSIKLRRQDRVVLCFFGDGATSRGDWHEGVNFASVMKLPVVFLCNNNEYAYSTPLHMQMAIGQVAERGPAYAMPADTVDGNDILAVYSSTRAAIERARAGLGPSLIECKTFRMTGHSAHDSAEYVPKEKWQEWEGRDPIRRYERALAMAQVLSQSEIEEMHRSVTEEVDAAVLWAENNPYPDPEECLRGVYCEGET
jgi:pyruvate dehydrogenase E1 component alpha subunit